MKFNYSSSNFYLNLFLLFISITTVINTQTQNITDSNFTSNNTTVLSSLCEGRIFNDENILTPKEIEELCITLTAAPEFLIRVRKYPATLAIGSVLMQDSSNELFIKVCPIFPSMCENGFLLDIYTKEFIIILQPGRIAKKLVPENYRQRVIETMRYNIINEEWALALDKGVKLLDYKIKGGTTQINQLQSSEPKSFIWGVLIPVLLFMFIGLTATLYFLGKGIINNSLYRYMDRVLDLWEKIDKSEEAMYVLPARTCLFCLKEDKLENDGTLIYKFLYCNHYYHKVCFYKWGLENKKCCPCSFEPVEGEEFSTLDSCRKPILLIADLKILLGFILDAFRKQDVYDYFIDNEEKINEFNKNYFTNDSCLEDICWIYQNKLNKYKKNRVFVKMWKALKMMICVLAFYPSNYLNSKKGRLIRKLLQVRATGSTMKDFK